ncbi:MAG: methionine gamma-lyase family protein [Clostridia bacterium]|nr:methionine gamma-lyase family protein [Clostridia bacterium]
MYDNFDFEPRLIELAKEAEQDCKEYFDKFDELCLINSAKVLKAFKDARVASSDFAEVNGYGYYDAGRDRIEEIYASIFKAEDALVRPQIMSGTHALSLTFFGLLNHGDTFISITGTPYDSLLSIIGTAGNSRKSLIASGVQYEEIPLKEDDFDIPAIVSRLKQSKVKLVEIQRSRGYSSRKSLSIAKIEKVCKAIREVDKDVIIMVDNCYGDFVEDREPIEVGADIIVGSLMKNLGGGICKSGGYIVGKKDLIFDIAERFTAPGVGKELGANFNENLSYFKGLFLSPRAVTSSLKTMVFASRLLEKLGYDVDPLYSEERTDIIQTITLHNEQNMINFHKGIQQGSPIDSFVTPVPGPMPGYPHEEIMASGTFTQGATIELSSDGPMVEPYVAYMQGGLTYEYGKLGIMIAVNEMLKK